MQKADTGRHKPAFAATGRHRPCNATGASPAESGPRCAARARPADPARAVATRMHADSMQTGAQTPCTDSHGAVLAQARCLPCAGPPVGISAETRMCQCRDSDARSEYQCRDWDARSEQRLPGAGDGGVREDGAGGGARIRRARGGARPEAGMRVSARRARCKHLERPPTDGFMDFLFPVDHECY